MTTAEAPPPPLQMEATPIFPLFCFKTFIKVTMIRAPEQLENRVFREERRQKQKKTIIIPLLLLLLLKITNDENKFTRWGGQEQQHHR